MGLVASTGPVVGIDEGEGGDLALGDVLSVGIGTASDETRVCEVCSASVEVRVLDGALTRSESEDGGPVRLHQAIRGLRNIVKETHRGTSAPRSWRRRSLVASTESTT